MRVVHSGKYYYGHFVSPGRPVLGWATVQTKQKQMLPSRAVWLRIISSQIRSEREDVDPLHYLHHTWELRTLTLTLSSRIDQLANNLIIAASLSLINLFIHDRFVSKNHKRRVIFTLLYNIYYYPQLFGKQRQLYSSEYFDQILNSLLLNFVESGISSVTVSYFDF